MNLHAIFDLHYKQDYYYCQRCFKSGIPVEIHHIIYRSELRKHPEVHNYKNLTRVCRECHSWYHKNKQNRAKIVHERKLWELYPHLPYLNAYKTFTDTEPIKPSYDFF